MGGQEKNLRIRTRRIFTLGFDCRRNQQSRARFGPAREIEKIAVRTVSINRVRPLGLRGCEQQDHPSASFSGQRLPPGAIVGIRLPIQSRAQLSEK